MTHWLRFVEDNSTTNQSRWPLHPTWATLRDAFPRLAQQQTHPLGTGGRMVVHGSRYNRKARIVRRLQLGVINSLEVEDASTTSAVLQALQRWVVIIAEREMDKIAAECGRYESQGKPIPRWVWRGMEKSDTTVSSRSSTACACCLGSSARMASCRLSSNQPTRSATCWCNI
jgi:hypothetical protein